MVDKGPLAKATFDKWQRTQAASAKAKTGEQARAAESARRDSIYAGASKKLYGKKD